MQLIIIKVDPRLVPPKIIERVVQSLIQAKNGTIIIAHADMTFETLNVDVPNEGLLSDTVLVAITKDGKEMKILHDPRENIPDKPEYKH